MDVRCWRREGGREGGNCVALCCWPLFYIGNIPSPHPPNPSVSPSTASDVILQRWHWSRHTLILLLAVAPPLVPSCLRPRRLPGVGTLQLLTPATPRPPQSYTSSPSASRHTVPPAGVVEGFSPMSRSYSNRQPSSNLSLESKMSCSPPVALPDIRILKERGN